MSRLRCLIAVALTAASSSALSAQIDVQALIKQYQSIKTVTCSVRKTTKAGTQTVRVLSRVHYKKSGFIHVENVSPAPRRIIADGKDLYYYDSSAKKGFSRPVSDLDSMWASSLQTVPASPMEHLFKLQGMKQAAKESTERGIHIEFHGEKNHVRMTLDSDDRITALEFFKDEAMKERYAIYRYSDFIKAGSTWLAQKHEAELTLPDGTKATETRLFDNLVVDTAIPDKLFDHRLFMKDVSFVADFEDTWR